MTQTIQHPTYTDAVQRGQPTTAPNGATIDEDGFFEAADGDAVTEMMDTLAVTYGVEYTDEGEVVTDGALAAMEADATFDPRDVSGVGDALGARIAERNDTVADLLTGTEDQQPEDTLTEIDGIDADLGGDITQAALDASAESAASEASIGVVAPDNDE